MKKAEDIYQNNYNLDRDEDGNEVFYKWQVIDAIKEAQINAIKETAKACAESAEVNILNKHPKNAKVSIVEVDKQSILSVSDELIDKL